MARSTRQASPRRFGWLTWRKNQIHGACLAADVLSRSKPSLAHRSTPHRGRFDDRINLAIIWPEWLLRSFSLPKRVECSRDAFVSLDLGAMHDAPRPRVERVTPMQNR